MRVLRIYSTTTTPLGIQACAFGHVVITTEVEPAECAPDALFILFAEGTATTAELILLAEDLNKPLSSPSSMSRYNPYPHSHHTPCAEHVFIWHLPWGFSWKEKESIRLALHQKRLTRDQTGKDTKNLNLTLLPT